MKTEYIIILVLALVAGYLFFRQQWQKDDVFQKSFDEFIARFSKVVDELNQVKLDSSRHSVHIKTIASDLVDIKKKLNILGHNITRLDKKNNELINSLKLFSEELNDLKFNNKFAKSLEKTGIQK
jgi:hypothetical protein